MENIKNKIDNNFKIESLLLKINNQKEKDEKYCRGQEVVFPSIDLIVFNIIELQNLFHDYIKLNETSIKLLESNLKKNIISFSNSIKINDKLINVKLSKVDVIDNKIYKNSDKINNNINYLYIIQFVLMLGFNYLLCCRFF